MKKPKVDKEPVVADEEKQETVKQEQPKKQEKKVEEKVAAKEEVKKEPVKQESVVEPVEEKNPAKEEVKPETKVEEISTNTKITEDVPTSKVEEKVIEEPIQKVEVQKEEEKKVEETPNTKEKQKPVARQEDVVKEQSIKNLEEEVVVEKEKHTSPKNIQPKKDIKEPVDTNTPVEEAQNTPAEEGEEEQTPEKLIQAKAEKLQGLKIIGKIELPKEKSRKGKPVASSDDKDKDKRKRKRKRVKKAKSGPIGGQQGQGGGNDRNDRNNRNDNRNDNRNNDRNDRNDNRNKDNNSNSRDKDGHKKDNSGANQQKGGGDSNKKRGKNRRHKEEVSQKEVDSSYKKTMAKMSGNVKNTRSSKSKYRREKRQAKAEERDQQMQQAEQEALTLKVTEFISTSELATLMDVSVNDVITKCLGLGMFVSINQRLDAEAITIIADEFGFEVDFSSAEEEVDVVLEEEDKEEDLVDRAPIVTIMGHVDHGKTSLLDYIRSAQVAEGEAGGITQHIGAYDVVTESGRRIVFLDTPGHEAFTAMRARGAKVTDVVIIVIAADDNVMPQTVEALNHAQVAGVPFVIAINKVDKPGANPDNIRSQLANMNILVESWGGKIQEQEISAKTGQGIEDLLELVLLESDILELKANPDKKAIGTVIEASLDKGKGYVSTVLIEAGTLQVGDIILSGSYYGRVKAMTDHRATRLKKAGPATPIQVLGLNGAPQAGDKFNAMDSEREAREIATKRSQIMREQSIRATKRTTLSDLGRRIALGNFHQLNIILKGDVDGSIEALSDSLLKLSTDEVEVNIIHKAVGPISESDVYLATTSDAIVIGFQVRPVASARRLADKEEVEIRLYSVIYDAINDVKDAMEGLLSPDIEEEIVGNIEVREVFKISKVGTVAGCYVTSGYVKRNSKVRLIRDGIVVYGGETGGEINALKRFKDDVNEVKQSFECGLSIKNYNDIKVGDIVEVFELKELKRTL
ncbi:MAG: translation initiation factor IF-2 [Flammeovirgaceae bacterium]